MGEKTAMQSKVMLSIVCVGGGAQNSISPRATKGLEPALLAVDIFLLKLWKHTICSGLAGEKTYLI